MKNFSCEKRKSGRTFISISALLCGLFISSLTASAQQTAVVATAAADYSSGAHSVISVDPIGGPRDVQNDLVPTISDISVVAFGQYFYRIEKFMANNVIKFNIRKPDKAIWQYSTDEPGDTNSNPHDLIFLSPQKAYLLRYESNIAWIVNPSTTTEAGFKIGELDLRPYADSDGISEMDKGVIVGNKLFIVLQRLDRNNFWSPTNTPYVAVFDTTNDIEIDTTLVSGVTNPDPVVGIQLPVHNPVSIQYLPDNGTIYAAGVEGYSAAAPGGIASINPNTYEVNTVLDGGAPYGAIAGISIVSPTKGYFVGYAGWGDNTLYSFDPSDPNPVGSAVTGFVNMSIGGMDSTLALDENGMLWICNQTDGQIDILDPTTDSIDESIDTNLNPLKVVFAEGEASDAEDAEEDDDGMAGCFISSSGSIWKK
ncbi:MAG: hypothetical protein JW932_03715 [Deltaproteobacteria bacterium]|nr:hypothetical protein [Deltaproteobacteria bacterium]